MREIIRIEAKPSIEIPMVMLVEIINKIPRVGLQELKTLRTLLKHSMV